jgi:nucleoside 2-deoxyribosyltransferase
MYSVFISHSFKDSGLVDTLRTALTQAGVDSYLAEIDPQYGIALPEKIGKAIDSADAIIVVLTKEANVSPSVNQEVGYAKKAQKLIVAMVEEGASTGAMIQGLEVVRFTVDKIGEAIEKVSNYVKRLAKNADQENLAWTIVGASVAILAIIALFALAARKK